MRCGYIPLKLLFRIGHFVEVVKCNIRKKESLMLKRMEKLRALTFFCHLHKYS